MRFLHITLHAYRIYTAYSPILDGYHRIPSYTMIFGALLLT